MPRVKGWPPAHLTKVPAADVKRGDGPLVREFIEALCPQVKDSIGGRAGEPLILRPWQTKLLDQLFARRPDGRLRHRTGLIGLPRKNGKSALGSGIGLYGLMMGPAGGEVYSCAADRDQARIVFGMARNMVEKSPELAESTKVYRDAIEVPTTGSVYRVLSSEAFTKEGLSPTLVIYDELHAAPNDELWNVMSLAQAARLDALVLGITTAGVKSDNTGQDSTCYRLFQYGSRIAAGEVDDPSFFMAWWQSKDSADHRSPASWKSANPGFGDLQDPEDFASAVKRTPENEFRTKRMNQWVNAQTAWLPTGAWDALDKTDPPVDDVPVVLFVDGSFSGDSTFIAGCTVEEKPRIWKVAAWEKQPEDTDDWRVDIGEVEATVFEACKRWNVVEVPFDPFRWQRSMQSLSDAGLPIVEYPTSSPARMVPSCAKFYDAVMSGGIEHDHDPQLSRHLQQAVVKTDRLGPRIVKESKNSPRKIDGAVCAVGAFDRATSYREAAPMAAPQFFA
ncbi:MAG TPA: terminase large subunit [Acidimicrobiia bacterium]